MIIISGRFRGPELKGSRIDHAVTAAMKAMERIREPQFGGSLGEVPHVNAVFVVEGSLGAPEFERIRLGQYSRKRKCIQVDIAVTAPDAAATNLRDVLVLGLRGANAAAFHFFEGAKIEFGLRDAEALVSSVGTELAEFS